MRKSLALLALVALAGPLRAADPQVHVVTPADAGYAPYLRYAPDSPAGRLDWLLVVPEALAAEFAPLVRHRRDTGLAVGVVTVEQVRQDILLGGGDLPERLRNLVRRLHAEYGLRHLVLAADSELLPSRMVPFGPSGEAVHHGELLASDAYFGCLDGEWNADGDALFGEAEPGDDDDPDVVPEVYVGRIPVEDSREAETYVQKLLLYERPTHLDYQDKIVYLGGKVFTENDADTHYRHVQESRFGPLGFAAQFFTIAGEGARPADVFAALSEGAGIVAHYHHSFTYNLSLPTGAIDTGNVDQIANAERPFVFFSNGCYSNQFTKESISEAILLSATGGAAAFIGSTNTCYSTSLGLEEWFWEEVFKDRVAPLGEGLGRMRARVTDHVGVLGFLRLSLNLLGDPATKPWPGRPVRAEFDVHAEKDGSVRVVRTMKSTGAVVATCVQEGPFAAWREPLEFPAGKDEVRFPPVVGNGSPLRVTVHGDRVVSETKEIADPVAVHLTGLTAADGTITARLAGADDEVVPVPDDPAPGPLVVTRDVAGASLRIVVPVVEGADVGYVHAGKETRFPGLTRLAAPRPDGLPLVAGGAPRIVREADGAGGDIAPTVETETTESTIRLAWDSHPGARWIVAREGPDGTHVLTPVPLVNPVFELSGLAPLTEARLVVSRQGGTGETRVTARTSFPFQVGFPQRIGANITSAQLLDLDGKRGKEMLFGDDEKGLWAIHADGSEVRHAGDNWTFGLFAAIPHGVFEPVVAKFSRTRHMDVLATSKLDDRKLYAFTEDGDPLPGFPVSFRSRLMTPPLVGDFDGKPGNEAIVVSGFGKTVELVRPDGKVEPYAEIGQYNYGYPIAVNLDRDRALEIVLLDGSGKVHLFDAGEERKGFPVDLGGPGRATPMIADVDGDKKPEIIALAKGTTRLAVIDPKDGKIKADLALPGSGPPSNYSLFYPGVADLSGKGTLSIVVGTPAPEPGPKLYAFDLEKKGLVVREGFPLDLPAEARGIAAVDIDGDGRDELFVSLFDGTLLGLTATGEALPGFPLATRADTYGVPLVEDLDGDGDLELILGAADGMLRVWDLPYRAGRKPPTWRGLLNGTGMPGTPGGG